MARYRKVEVATWVDSRFASLSAPQPNAQTVWLYLLTGPRTTVFPGLVAARAEVMASDLGWSTEAFREAFAEVSAKGLAKADWKGGLVVLKKALIDSSGYPRGTARPESPNVIKHWAKQWDEVPDSPLKDEYLSALGSFAEGLGAAFLEAFREGFRKALAKGTPHPCPNQDQDQDQDQKQDQERYFALSRSEDSPQLAAFKRAVDSSVSAQRKRTKKPKPSEPTEAETATARVVLERLGAKNGIAYSGSVEHVKLIVDRLRDGYTELDLRKVVAHQADEWADDDKMRRHLRPETLFGPKTIQRYIDAARTAYKHVETLPQQVSQ